MKKTLRKVLPVLALVLVVAVASVGGTIAWLTDKTDTVTNTFTVGDINIELKETLKPDGTPLGNNETWSAKLIPGSVYAKDPKVTVKAGSEDCYLFVKFEEINNPSTYLDYISLLNTEQGWIELESASSSGSSVWYREVDSDATKDQSWYLLAGDNSGEKFTNGKVTVKSDLVKTGTTGEGVVAMPSAQNAPKLQYTAYAIQKEHFDDPADAWTEVNK